ncbi:MAG TPA: pantetheine-phosphate adenylyltransferase [Verrucomicrobiae bacterium]|jgi:pantetheine-phosphate adenylyltransferase|nr:pantetheine-phosphate adenylyltransferase [Verrucomicrobiae bacterium]
MARTKIAVYPGSFDPITNGHVDLVKRTLGVFDRIIVAIARNPDKDHSLFDLEERLEMIRQVFKGFGRRVAAESFDGLLVNYAKKSGAKVIIRGLRAISDFEYEFQMAMMNRELEPGLETLFMMTGQDHFYISSRLVKEVVSLGGDISGLVPALVAKKLKERF